MDKVEIIKNTTVAPYRSLARLQTQRSGLLGKREYTSTAFFVKENVMLTAGHNVFSQVGSRISYVWVTPASNGEIMPYGDLSILKSELPAAINCHPKYRMGQRTMVKRQYDMAAIVLPKHAIQQLQNWMFQPDLVLDEKVMVEQGEKIFIAGYPGYGELHPSFDGSICAADSGVAMGFDRNYMMHDLDTETGNSGSPIWVERDGRRIVVAIHTFDSGATLISKLDHQWIGAL